MTLHSLPGRRRRLTLVLGLAVALAVGTVTVPAYAAAEPTSAPTLNVNDGDTLEGTVRLVADAAVENDPVVSLAVDGARIADAGTTVGTAHLEFDMGGNGTERRYHNYLTVNGHTAQDERIYFPDIAGGKRGDLTFPGAWLHSGQNTITVHAGWNWVDTTNTAAVGYEALPNGEGGRCPNYDDFSVSSISLGLLGVVADGEENLFSYSFGDGTCGSGTKLLKQDLVFTITGEGGTGGLSADLDTTALANGQHTLTATAESGAATSVEVEVNNAPAGSPRITPADGALVNGTKPVIGALPVSGSGAVESLTLDGSPAQTAETLASGTSTFSFTVLAGNSLEARYHNFAVVNGHRIDVGGDYGVPGDERVELRIPHRFLKPGDNQLELRTGDYNSGSGASLCANHDDFKVSGPALVLGGAGTVTEGTHYTVTTAGRTPTTGTFTLGDGTCGLNKDAEFHFTVADAPTTRTVDTLGSAAIAHLRFFVGGNGSDSGYLNKVLVNGIPTEMGIWEKEVADLSIPNEWLVPGVNVIEFAGGILPTSVDPATCPRGNLDDFTLRDFQLVPAEGTATQLTKEIAQSAVTIGSSSYPAGSQVTVFIGDGTCNGNFSYAHEKQILFEVSGEGGGPAAVRGLRADVDTSTIADGQHTVTATAGDKSATRRFSVDNSAPVVVTSVPAASQHLTANVSLDVQLDDASGVAGDPAITLDGRTVKVGDTIGHGLAAGDHVLAVTATDSLGNKATREVRFTSASIPDVPADLAATVEGDSATLSALIPGEDGTQLDASFTQADVVIPATAYQGTARAVPTQLDVTADISVIAVKRLQPADSRSVDTPSSGDVVFQRYDLTVPASQRRPTLRWEGVIDPARLVSLRAWHPIDQQWVVLTSARGSSGTDATTVLTAQVGDAYRDGGTVHVMVTGEDPFSDDLAPRDASAKDDKDHFEDPTAYDFAIAHFTDTQYLSEGAAGGTYNDWDGVEEASDVQAAEEQALWKQAYEDTTQWIVDNAQTRKIAYTAHTGDIIENDYHNPLATGPTGQLLRPGLDEQVTKEFAVSSEIQGILDENGVVNQVIGGNHDNQLGAEVGPNSRFSRTFSTQRYYEASQSWPAGAEYHSWDEVTAEDGTVTTPGQDSQNNYVLFSAGGLDFVAVGLSYGVTPAEARWADSVLERYQDRNGILLSHDYLVPSTAKDGRGAAFSNPDGSMLYKQVVENNPNVFLVLAGHEHGVATNLKTKIGATVAHNVVELLADYQFYTVSAGQLFPDAVDGDGNVDVDGDGVVDHRATDRLQFGASFLRLMQFDVERGEMSVDTYSPFLDEFGATAYDLRADGSQTTPRYNGAEDNMVLPVDLSSRKTSFSSDSLAAYVPTEEIGADTVTAGDTASVTWEGLRPGRSYGWFVTASSTDGGTAVAQPSVFRTAQVDAAVTADPVTVSYGAAAAVTVEVSGADDTSGTVTVSEGATELGSAEVVDGVATVTVPAGLAPGVHHLTAAYSGSDALLPGQSTVDLTVLPGDANVQATAGTVLAGDDAIVSVSVAGGGGTGTGSVEVREGSTTLGTAALAGGSASVRVPGLTVGTHQLGVLYSGDDRVAAGSSALTVTVVARRSSVTASASPVTVGTAGTVAVTVDGGGLPATGTVTVTEGAATLGTATLASGTATVRLPADLAAGTHQLTASYSGNDRVLSSSTTVTLQVNARAKRAPVVRATAPRSVRIGASFKVRVKVSAGKPTATGRVAVLYRGRRVGTAGLDGGTAVVRVRGDFPAGRRTLTVEYLGSADVAAGSDGLTVRFVQGRRPRR